MRRACVLSFVLLIPPVLASAAGAQPVPQPFPRPGEPRPGASGQAPQAPRPASAQTAPAPPAAEAPPDETTLGVPVYPGAQFIRSYDAGQGQRYYLFGANTSFTDLVNYYRTVLKTRGELVYDQPPIHMFDIGRFREDSMAFPPSVTVKDYTWGGSKGYLLPLPGGKSQRFSSVVQIVPAPPAGRR